MSQVLREHAIGKLTTGMSIRAVAREFNLAASNVILENLAVHPTGFTTADHIRLLHLRDHLRPATRAADETVGLHN
jgi:hypothetical protein